MYVCAQNKHNTCMDVKGFMIDVPLMQRVIINSCSKD